jgi:hypothetical protein
LYLQEGIHRLKPGKVPLNDPSAGWTILRIEEIDLDGGRGLSKAIHGERKENDENKQINGKKELPHKSPLRLRCIQKAPNPGLVIPDFLKY